MAGEVEFHPSCCQPLSLEQEWIQVSSELKFLWHRQPLERVDEQFSEPGTVRILVNGCFDLMHVGHFNVLRQAKHLFYQKGFKKVVLIAGMHCDESITNQKRPPLLSEQERFPVLQATKWVDEYITSLPYTRMTCALADVLRVHWICHGDDLPLIKDGSDMYSDPIAHGRFQILRRTEGISTTIILDRMLQVAEDFSVKDFEGSCSGTSFGSFLATSQRIAAFAAPANPGRSSRCLSDAKRVVYIPGVFDLVHAGHVELLQQAATFGDYVLVGLYADDTVRRIKGVAPTLTLMERSIAMLSLRFVDDVIFGAPWKVTADLLMSMSVAVVVIGWKGDQRKCLSDANVLGIEANDQLSLARERDMLREVPVRSSLSSESIRRRVLQRRCSIAERNSALLQKECAYSETRQHMREA